MTHPLPDWIADERLLRDEAVLFGLSDARPDEKLATIRLTFAALTAPLDKQVEQGHEAIGDLNETLEAARQQQTYLTQQLDAAPPPRPPIGWFALGLAVSVGLAVGLGIELLRAAPNASMLAWILAGLLGLTGCAGTLLFAFRQHRAQLTHYTQQRAARTAALKQAVYQQRIAQAAKQEQVATLYATEAQLAQLNAIRDRLLRLFESEFDLARSVRQRINGAYFSMYNGQ